MTPIEGGLEGLQLGADTEDTLTAADARGFQRTAFGGFRFFELRHGPRAHHPNVDDFDRVVGEEMPVLALVGLVEELPHPLEALRCDCAGGQRDLELVALTD